MFCPARPLCSAFRSPAHTWVFVFTRRCASVRAGSAAGKATLFLQKKKGDFSFVFTLDIKKTRILKILYRRLFSFSHRKFLIL